jgi:hypothetical protein
VRQGEVGFERETRQLLRAKDVQSMSCAFDTKHCRRRVGTAGPTVSSRGRVIRPCPVEEHLTKVPPPPSQTRPHRAEKPTSALTRAREQESLAARDTARAVFAEGLDVRRTGLVASLAEPRMRQYRRAPVAGSEAKLRSYRRTASTTTTS